MANRQRDADFTEYVHTKTPWLRRVAFLLCQDWHRADDLVQAAFLKLFVNWDKARRADNFDGYVRTMLVNTFLSEQQSNWWKRISLHREQFSDPVFDVAVLERDVDGSMDLLSALAAVPPRQRAAIVLRYYCDLSVEETAIQLGCSAGTVKSQTSRGLDALRVVLEAHPAN